MEFDYMLTIPLALAALLFIGWIVWRNLRDKKKFEKDTINSEIKPEKHDKDHI